MVRELNISPATKIKLCSTLKKFPNLFSGGLSKVNSVLIHIGLKKEIKPVKDQYYSVSNAFEGVTKQEINQMCEI